MVEIKDGGYTYGASKHMGGVQTYGASKHTRGIQTYGGNPNILGGGPNIWEAIKHRGVHPNI